MNTLSIDISSVTNNGQLLWQWLGQFWSKVYQNPELTKNLQYGQGLLSAQLYLDYVEGLSFVNRNVVPAFHRERWKPVRILKSQAGTGNAALLRVSASPAAVVGPQLTSDYVKGETFNVGGPVDFNGSVSYPIDGVKNVMVAVCNSILAPATVLVQGTDFTVVDSTIFFLREKDPFNDASFPTRNVSDTDGTVDQELILWCMDTLEDLDFVYKYLGYVFNVKMESSELYRNMINRIWDLHNLGTPVQLLQSAVGAILGEPTILNPEETVSLVLHDASNAVTQVITDKAVYTLPSTAVLRSVVSPGAVLKAGDFLSQTIRLYSNINPQQLGSCGEYGMRIKVDLPALFVGRTLLKSEVQYGVGASWELSDIVSAGTDSNGNPKLKFDLFGDTQDVDLFWNDFWAYLERNGMSSATCFADYLDPEPGYTYGRVAPLEYFMRYFLRPNMFVMVVESDNLTVQGRQNINSLALLQRVLPSHVLMMITVQRHVSETPYSLATVTEDTTVAAAYVAADTARPGGPSPLSLTYRDRSPILRWIPTCS